MSELFDEKKLQQSVKKAKRKSLLKTVLIALLVFIIGSIGNIVVTVLQSHKSFDREEAWVELSNPNSFISSSFDTIGFLGGSRTYKIAKTVGPKTVILEERTSPFGLLPTIQVNRVQGGSGYIEREWQISHWENGDRKMIFFHPEIQYKKYKNDLAELDKLPDSTWIEMAVSFDQPYYPYDLDTVIPTTINRSWLWLDTYSKKEIATYKKEAKEYDPGASFINEHNTIGLKVRSNFLYSSDYEAAYSELLNKLKQSPNQKHTEIYKLLNQRKYDDYHKGKILGAIVYGTKKDLKPLQGNPSVKATSFGVITNEY